MTPPIPHRQYTAIPHYQRHVLAWYALGRVQQASAAWATVCELRRRPADPHVLNAHLRRS